MLGLFTAFLQINLEKLVHVLLRISHRMERLAGAFEWGANGSIIIYRDETFDFAESFLASKGRRNPPKHQKPHVRYPFCRHLGRRQR